MHRRKQVSFRSFGIAASFFITAAGSFTWLGSAVFDGTASSYVRSIPGMSVAAVRADPWSGRVELDGVSAADGAVSWSARRLVLRMQPSSFPPAFLASAFAQTAPLVAQNVVIHAPGIDYTIPRLELDGTSLSSADLAGILNAKSTVPLKDRLAKLTAAAIMMPRVTGTSTGSGEKLMIAYGDVKITNVAAGKIGDLSIGNAALKLGTDADPDMNATYGAVDVKGLDLVQAAHVITELRQDPNEPLAPIVDSVTIASITMHSPGNFDATVGKIALQKLSMRAFARQGAAPAPGANASSRTTGTTPPADTSSGNGSPSFVDVAGEVLGDVSVGSLDVDGVAVVPPDADDLNLKIAHIHLAQFANGTLGQLAYQGFDFAKDHGRITADALAFGNVDFNAPLAATKAALRKDRSMDLDDLDPRVVLPNPGSIALSKLSVNVPSGDDDDDPNSRVRFQVSAFNAALSNYLNGVPTGVKASLGDLTIALPPDPGPELQPLVGMGYRNLDLSATVDAAWDPATQEIRVTQIAANGADIGGVKIAGLIGNVGKDFFAVDFPTAGQAAAKAVVKNIDLTVENAGVVERALQAEAGDLGIAPADMTRYASVASALAIAAGQFMANPKTFHINVSSTDGIGALDVLGDSDPRTLLGKINISVDADQASPATLPRTPQATSGRAAPAGPSPAPTAATAPAAQYFYAANGQPTGPVMLPELAALLASGSLPSDTLVWKQGTPAWVAASSLPEVVASLTGPADPQSYLVGTWKIAQPSPGENTSANSLTVSMKADGTLNGTYSVILATSPIPVAGTWSAESEPDKRIDVTMNMGPSQNVSPHWILTIVDGNTARDGNGELWTRVGP